MTSEPLWSYLSKGPVKAAQRFLGSGKVTRRMLLARAPRPPATSISSTDAHDSGVMGR